MNPLNDIKLTQYSHGAGCGCKISPGVLETILQSNFSFPDDDKLIVGNHSRDDAAVYNLGNGQALISTTDFFMPVVDDPFDFGRIASANAISDVAADLSKAWSCLTKRTRRLLLASGERK